MNTTVAVVLPTWAVMLIAILCAASIVETTVRACNAALSGRLERQIRKNAADANAKPKGCTAPEWWDESAPGWHMGLDLARFAARVAAAEREACAKVCEEQAREPECPERAQYCADAIRARSTP